MTLTKITFSRPWWDPLEDYLVYGLVMLGLLTLPTSIITSGTPLDCNFCKDDICRDLGPEFNRTPADGKDTDPGFNAWWVKKYCTQVNMIVVFHIQVTITISMPFG